MRRASLALLILLGLAQGAARADEPAKYRFEPGGRVRAVRTADVNDDGRLDLVLLLSRPLDGGGHAQELLLLETPAEPTRGRFYPEGAVTRLAVDRGPLAGAGAVALGRFGTPPTFGLRFLAPDGIRAVSVDGAVTEPAGALATPTLLGRSTGRDLVFWDQTGDLDGDGRDELWFPRARGAGPLGVLAGDGRATVTLDGAAANRGVTDDEHLLRRHAYVPRLEAVDLEGDGRKELVACRYGTLVAWPYLVPQEADETVAPAFRLPLPFVKVDLGPDEVHTPRLQLRDVDGDGVTDLLVTLVTGDRRQLGSFRTRLLHYPGPFRDASGALVAPRVRIDTESVALHPHFVDLDGDGDLDYLSDSIRGTKLDLIKRVLGQDPTIWYVGFRFDAERGTFQTVPSFSLERPYSRDEAIGNRFGRTGFFEGDFDGDRFKDLLDLGDLAGLEVLKGRVREGAGVGDPVVFEPGLQPRVRVPKPLAADAVVADLDGDGRADAVLWSEDAVYLLVSGGSR